MGVIIQFRRGTAAEWTAANSILLSGEFGFETDTSKFKIGDGATTWDSLGYISAMPTGGVLLTDYDANTILAATVDNTPVALTVAEQELVGRLTGGAIDGIAMGIADNNVVQIDAADVADDEYARFTANGLESRTAAEVASALPRGITNDALVEIDGADIADDEYARFTANGLESRTKAEVITDLLSADLPENVVILIENALTHDGDFSGLAENGTAGAALAFGELCYLQETDGRWELADCGVELAASAKLGMCILAANADGDATRMLLRGNIRADAAFPDLTHAIGLPVYMGETAGDIVTTLVTTASHFVRIIGHGNGADELTFNPSNEYIQRIA